MLKITDITEGILYIQ